MVADLRAESDELDDLVAGLPDDCGRRQTPAAGLDHRPPDRAPAVDRPRRTASVTDEAGFADVREGRLDQTRSASSTPRAEELAATPPAELLADWRTTRARLHDALLEVADGRKLPWFGPPMSAASMATARLMETWAHGLDVADALGVAAPADGTAALDRAHRRPHPRLRLRRHGSPPPAEPFRVRAERPGRRPGRGDPTMPHSGSPAPAEDFCLLVTQRRPRGRARRRRPSGADASTWLTIAQAFAGHHPGAGRA